MKCFFCDKESEEVRRKESDPDVYLYDCPKCGEFFISRWDEDLIKERTDFNKENKEKVSNFIHKYNDKHGGKPVKILLLEDSKDSRKKNEYTFEEIVNQPNMEI